MHVRVRSMLSTIVAISLASTALATVAPKPEQTRAPKSPAAASVKKMDRSVPAWARDARWYHVVVDRFRNGDPSNDPPNTSPWPTDRPTHAAAGQKGPADSNTKRYGGDLQGLQERLPYISALGFNAIYLASIFDPAPTGNADQVDLRHVDDALGVKGALTKLGGETDEPATWKRSASDRLFLEFITTAHNHGFHVVVEAAIGRAATGIGSLPGIARRWIDPDGDGDPQDGIDGWVIPDPEKLPHKVCESWRTHTKNINPNVLLVGDTRDEPRPWLCAGEFDVMMEYGVGQAIRRLLDGGERTCTLAQFVDEVSAANRRCAWAVRSAVPTPLSAPQGGRALSELSSRRSAKASETKPGTPESGVHAGRARWRLASVLQYFLLGAPAVYYGDEVGMVDTERDHGLAPMWWEDRSKPSDSRADFVSLIKWLNLRREVHAPLRYGQFRRVLLDEAHRVLAFSRSLPGDEVVLIMNYGPTKQKVILQVGKPGQLVGALSPVLDPTVKAPPFVPKPPVEPGEIPPLLMGGSRQYVDSGGHIRLWVSPMSVRVALVREDAPWARPRTTAPTTKDGSGRK